MNNLTEQKNEVSCDTKNNGANRRIDRTDQWAEYNLVLRHRLRPLTTILLAGGLALTNMVFSGELLTIKPAHALPDYTKLKPVTDTATRLLWNEVAIGDFNHDGRLDAVVQFSTPPFPGDLPLSAVVFLQDTNGALIENASYPLPNTSVGIRLEPADVNEDGHLDILGDDSGNDIFLMLGNGDGTFQSPTFLGLEAAGWFSVGHLNGDAHLDLVAGRMDGTVGVFLGSGNGSLSLRSSLATLVKPTWEIWGQVLLGDVNGDERTDVVVCSIQDYSSRRGNLDVFLGIGDGTFQAVIRTTNAPVREGALGDFNGDGILDFAGDQIRIIGTDHSQGWLEIWLGKGDGSFKKGNTYPIDANAAVQVADLNHDGILDVITSGNDDVGVYLPQSVLLGNGDGTFQPKQSFTHAEGFRAMSWGSHFVDFNGDGRLDIISVAQMGSAPYTSALGVALSHGPKPDCNLGCQLTIQSTPGRSGNIVLETSTNLNTWAPIATNAKPINPWPVVVPNSTSVHYYRTYRP